MTDVILGPDGLNSYGSGVMARHGFTTQQFVRWFQNCLKKLRDSKKLRFGATSVIVIETDGALDNLLVGPDPERIAESEFAEDLTRLVQDLKDLGFTRFVLKILGTTRDKYTDAKVEFAGKLGLISSFDK